MIDELFYAPRLDPVRNVFAWSRGGGRI